MSYQNPWSMHYQSSWHERSGNPRLPLWLRVTSLAYGAHRMNGHAVFGPGDVAMCLSRVDHETGELVVPSRSTVRNAITRAMEYGFLAQGSGSRCLVVPPHAVRGGLGTAFESCRYHDRKRPA